MPKGQKVILERDVEKKLCDLAKEYRGTAYKFTSPQHRSVPDRLVLLPGGVVFFVELKAPGKHPTEAQVREHERLRALGIEVYVIDTIDGAVELMYDKSRRVR